MPNPIHIISLGAGVQSSTIALMASHGEITPMPMAAVFADTQAEPLSVYTWLDWLETQLPFPVYRVTKGSLEEISTRVRVSKNANAYTNGQPPAFMQVRRGEKPGILQRQCTGDFKINVICREIRRLREKRNVIQWIGISRDEAHRMKPSRLSYIEHRWPLIELGMTRNDCLDWMQDHGYPEPPRSSCVFCPYHSDAEWKKLKENEPEEFERAVQYEGKLQSAMRQTRLSGVPYLHRSCEPLHAIDFSKPSNQPNLFGNECEGVCGV
jgi:hypothetical protein